MLSAQEVLERAVAWAETRAGRWRYDDVFGGLLRATFARATKTFAAAVMLTGAGYGPQAAMLARSLFEDAIVSYWAVWIADPDWVVRRIEDHANHMRLLTEDTAEEYADVFGEIALPDDLPRGSERDRLLALFGRRASVSWWAPVLNRELPDRRPGPPDRVVGVRSLHRLVRELERAAPAIDAPDSVLAQGALPRLVRDLRLMYDVVQSCNNMYLHQTGASVLIAFDAEDESWRDGPSADWVRQAQGALYLGYEKLVLLMCDRFDPALATDWFTVSPDGFTPFVASPWPRRTAS